MLIYIILGVIIFILEEAVGFWFINTQMKIPSDRMSAARWVYQFSFMKTMFTVPYNASIIAHERMNVFAWVSISEVSLKLLTIYILVVIFSYDKLKLYAVLMFMGTTIISLIYPYLQKKIQRMLLLFLLGDKSF